MTERAILLNLPKIQPINISFENLSFSVTVGRKKEKKQIIKGINGEFRSGELTAIMGPSGAGKSSLMNILTGFQTKGMRGCVYTNGVERNRDGGGFKKDTCYIMQDDQLHGIFTVMETMTMAADLKLGHSLSEKAKIILKSSNESRSYKVATQHRRTQQQCQKALLKHLTKHRIWIDHLENRTKNCCTMLQRKMTQRVTRKYRITVTDTVLVLESNPPIYITTVVKKAGSHVGGTKSKIDDILQTLGLSSAKETKCQRLSGGQRKRLSIALELIDNPPVMFLDEPTTGLDSSSSLQCIKVLKALAKGGRTIVCTIHQPSASVYELFDHVYILAGGFCIYQGSSANTVPYLLSVGLPCPQYHNPADFIAEVANGEYGNFSQQLAVAAQDSRWRSITAKPEEMVMDKKGEKTAILIQQPSELTRLYVLLYRNTIRLHRDWTVTHLKLILHFLVGILLGLNYQGCGNDGSKTFENVTFVFCSIIYISYTSMMPAILTFPSELSILKKENFNNWYSLRTYYSAFILTSTPVQFLLCSAYASVAYYLSNQPLDMTRFAMFLGMCILVGLTAEGVGLYLGTLDNSLNALFFGSIFTAYLLVYSGCLCLFSQMPYYIYVFSYLSYGRYAFEGLILSVYGYGRAALPCPEDEVYCHLKFPDKIMSEMGLSDGRYWVDLLAIVAILFLFRTAAFIALRRKVCCGKI